MNVSEAIKGRRSIRSFKDEPLDNLVIEDILEHAKWAPSAGNLASRSIIVVKDSDKKRLLANAALNQDFIGNAPVVFVVCADIERSGERYGWRGRELYSVQDATLSAYAITLAAYSLGFGSCWVGAFDENIIKGILGIPPDIAVVALIPVGIPDEHPAKGERRIDIHREKW